MIAVYVPADERGSSLTRIEPESAIVGSSPEEFFLPALVHTDGENLVVDFEGNLYGSANLVTFADRVRQAAGRHAQKYPTVARMTIPASWMRRVGEWDGQEVVVDDDVARAALAAWLNVDPLPLDELRVSR